MLCGDLVLLEAAEHGEERTVAERQKGVLVVSCEHGKESSRQRAATHVVDVGPKRRFNSSMYVPVAMKWGTGKPKY